MNNLRDKFFDALRDQVVIVKQMANDRRVPSEHAPTVAELAAACHIFDVQRRCLNVLHPYVPDLVEAYVGTIFKADIFSLMLGDE